MRTMQRFLIAGLAAASAPFAVVVAAPSATAGCVSSGGSTVCAQGDVRGADGAPMVATPVVPYPCDYDWYCGDNSWDWNVDIDWNPGPGGPGGPGGPIIGRPGGGGGRGR